MLFRRRASAHSVVSAFRRTVGPLCPTVVRFPLLMPLRNRVYGAGKILILVGALLVTYIVFAVGSMRFALRAREVQVPDLTNQTTGEATLAVGQLGLNLKVDELKRVDLEDFCRTRARAGAGAGYNRSTATNGSRVAQRGSTSRHSARCHW